MKIEQKGFDNFEAPYRQTKSSYQPMKPYRWKAHFISYPSTYKTPYNDCQIRQ